MSRIRKEDVLGTFRFKPLVWGKTSTDPFSLRDVGSIVFGSLPCTVLRCYIEAWSV